VALLAATFSHASAQAAIQSGDSITLSVYQANGDHWSPYHAVVKDASGTVKADFLTFCVEKNEYFYNNQSFTVTDLGNVTNATNYSLSGYTAWVYEVYASRYAGLNPSSDLFSTIGGRTKADLFQEAIWGGMLVKSGAAVADGDTGLLGTASSEFVISSSEWSLLDQLGIGKTAYLASYWGQAGLSQTYGYKVIQIAPTNGFGQDQLYRPDGGPIGAVPAPSGLVNWAILAIACSFPMGLTWLKKRKLATLSPA